VTPSLRQRFSARFFSIAILLLALRGECSTELPTGLRERLGRVF
jgi:hypothetical protein